jgi:hypothetical protein
MDRAVVFCEALGFERHGGTSPMWTEFHLGDAIFALHGANEDDIPLASSHPSLNINVDGATLDRLYATCEARGYPLGGPIQDIGFGRFFWTTDPDGLPVQFNERPG